MSRRTNRREFLKQATLAGVGFWVAGGLSARESRAANDKINFACIGVGGKGRSDSSHAALFGNVVAICDIDERTLNARAKALPKAKKYHDFRKMLEEMGKSIDAVTVSTPDHTHAVAAMMAIKMKKHVYCQKPLTHSVYEARQLRLEAKKNKVATQMGNQGTASDGLRRAVEIIRAGALGPVREVHVWTNRPIWPQAPLIAARPKSAPVPKQVHWDLWLGPCPKRPYALYPDEEKFGRRKGQGAYHPFVWRGWWDFGTGALGDMGCHTANLAFMALQLGYPTSVEAECGDLNPETCPSWAKVTLEFPARGNKMPAVKFHWYEGKKDGKRVLPPADLTKGAANVPPSGSLLVGDKGILYSGHENGSSYRLLPEKDFKDYKGPEMTLPRHKIVRRNPKPGDLRNVDEAMKAEWVAAIRANKPQLALSNFDYSGLLTETILLGNVAMRVGKKIEWDGENARAKNCKEADKYIKLHYREGWEL
jgi:predicted dehydrogenase